MDLVVRLIWAAVVGIALCVWGGIAAAQGDLGQRLQETLDAWRAERSITGVTMAVAAPEIGVIEVASGVADVVADTAITPGHRLLLASSTKAFVATAVLDLVDTGELTLDDRLDRWFPEVANAADITIRQLLSHTSGVPDYLTPENRMRFATAALQRHPTGGPGFTPQELLELVHTLPSAFEPGTSFAYSNSNTVLLGGIIERITGAPLYEVLRDRLFLPYGLESFHIAGVEPAPASWGPGYTFEYAELFGSTDRQAEFDQHMSMLIASSGWASGALVGTAGDVARFQQALICGEMLEPATMNEMTAPSPVVEAFVASAGVPEIGGGLGVFLYQFPEPLGTAIGHDGGEPGFASAMLTFSDHCISISVLVNDDRADFAIFPRGADVDELLGAVALLALEDLRGG